MKLIKIDPSKLEKAYGVEFQILHPGEDGQLSPPFNLGYCEIAAKENSHAHNHYNGECFVFLEGHGQVVTGKEKVDVCKGDVTYIPNHVTHEIRNSSDSEALKYLAFYWDEDAFRERSSSEQFMIYAAPPTPNGSLHVGHLSGPYLAADILYRYLQTTGNRVLLSCGSDEHQSYVKAKALQLGEEPQEVANKFTRSIQAVLSKFGVKADNFLVPSENQGYHPFVQKFVDKLIESGAFVEEENEYPYCQSCSSFVHESTVSGFCPHCNEKTNGIGCEACGLYNDGRDLIDPVCNLCGEKSQPRKSRRYVFRVSDWEDRLRSELDSRPLPTEMRELVNEVFARGLPDITITYPYDWGFSCAEDKTTVVFEWVALAAGYLYLAGGDDSSESYRHFWSEKNKVVIAFGFDNAFPYLFALPALLWAYDEEIEYPDHFLTNHFYLLDHKKFSTSRNHVIWGDDILETYHSDAVRLYLAKTRPERHESNFDYGDFESYVEGFGVGVLDKIIEQFALETWQSDGDVNDVDRHALELWNLLIRKAQLALDPSFLEANKLVSIIEEYAQSLLRYSMCGPDQCRADVGLAGLQGLAQLLLPVCPEFGSRVFRCLGVDQKWVRDLERYQGVLNKKELPLHFFRDARE